MIPTLLRIYWTTLSRDRVAAHRVELRCRPAQAHRAGPGTPRVGFLATHAIGKRLDGVVVAELPGRRDQQSCCGEPIEIGRASCRERV